MKHYTNKFIILIIFFLLFNAHSHSEVSIQINDTTIQSDVITLPIRGITDDFSNKKVDYYFQISWVQFDILDIITHPNYGFFTTISYDIDRETNILKISSDFVKSYFTGTLFELELLIHARMDFFGPWEVFEITPLKIITTDSHDVITQYDIDSPSAKVHIEISTANPTFFESVSLNYPNPFNYQTNVFFSIYDPTTIKMQLYNPAGSLLQTMPNPDSDDAYLSYIIFNSNNQEVASLNNDWTKYEFEKGIYKINFRVRRDFIALGIYRLILTTNNNNYTINLVFAN